MTTEQEPAATPVYTHTQTGTAIIFTLGFALFGITLGLFAVGATGLWLIPAFVLALAILLFHSLTVIVDDEVVEVALGNRWIRREVPVNRIMSARRVRNPISLGWGLRKVGDLWSYAVSGRDAVEIELIGDPTIIRIGTDEPDELEAAIRIRLLRR